METMPNMNNEEELNNSEQSITPELQEKMTSFESHYNSSKVNKLVNKLNLGSGAAFYEFDDEKQRHVFLKKGTFGYKNIFNDEEAEQMNSIINDAAEILSVNDPIKEMRLVTENDSNKKQIVVRDNFGSFFRKTIEHIRGINK